MAAKLLPKTKGRRKRGSGSKNSKKVQSSKRPKKVDPKTSLKSLSPTKAPVEELSVEDIGKKWLTDYCSSSLLEEPLNPELYYGTSLWSSDPEIILRECANVLEKYNIPFSQKYCHCVISTLIKNELTLIDSNLYILELKRKVKELSDTDCEKVEKSMLELLDVDSWYSRMHLESTERVENLCTRILELEIEMIPLKVGSDS